MYLSTSKIYRRDEQTSSGPSHGSIKLHAQNWNQTSLAQMGASIFFMDHSSLMHTARHWSSQYFWLVLLQEALASLYLWFECSNSSCLLVHRSSIIPTPGKVSLHVTHHETSHNWVQTLFSWCAGTARTASRSSAHESYDTIKKSFLAHLSPKKLHPCCTVELANERDLATPPLKTIC